MDKHHLLQYYNIVNQLYDFFEGGFNRIHPADADFGKLMQSSQTAALKNKENLFPEDHSSSENALPSLPNFESLENLTACAQVCARCPLAFERKNTVVGMGCTNPTVFVVGEGPGASEDEQGLPFVGAAGQYLDKWLEAIGLSRKTNCYIANIVKCRPPNNRDPQKNEIEACIGYLDAQIAFLRPKIIFACGRIAGQRLSGKNSALVSLRQKIFSYQNIPLVITYHPAGVLRNPDLRRPVWEDLKFLKNLLEEMPKN